MSRTLIRLWTRGHRSQKLLFSGRNNDQQFTSLAAEERVFGFTYLIGVFACRYCARDRGIEDQLFCDGARFRSS